MDFYNPFVANSPSRGAGRHRVSPMKGAVGWTQTGAEVATGAELDDKGAAFQLRTATERVEQFRQAVHDANVRTASVEQQLQCERAKNDELRVQIKNNKQALTEIAEHFKDSCLLKSEGQLLAHAAALHKAGAHELAALLEGLLLRDRILGGALEAATGMPFNPPTPAKLPAPPQVTEIPQEATPGVAYHRSRSAPSCLLSDAIHHEAMPANFKEVEEDDYWWSSAGQQSESTGVKGGQYSSKDTECSRSQNRAASTPNVFKRATHKMAKRMGLSGNKSASYQDMPKGAQFGTGLGRMPNFNFYS